MRCFIAIELPEHLKSKIFHKAETLEKEGLFNGKITEKENLHLTLKFFGDVTEEEIQEIKGKLSKLDFRKMNVKLGKTGFFDDENHIRILWVELISHGIEPLRKKISESTLKFKEDTDFNSHITFARIKKVLAKNKLLENLKKIIFHEPEFEVSEFVLMKSELLKSGPRYKILEKFGLK